MLALDMLWNQFKKTELKPVLPMLALRSSSPVAFGPLSTTGNIMESSDQGASQRHGAGLHIAGLILARGGSKRIPLKNLSPLRGKPLLLWALGAMTRCQGFDSVWVSSDHDNILETAAANGAQPHRRSPAASVDMASSLESTLEFLDSHPEVDVVGLVQCTSPFLRTEDLEVACDRIRGGDESVFAVTRSHCLRWEETSSGELRPVNFNPERRPRRQDWAGDLIETGAFYFTTVALLRKGLIQGGKMSCVEISEQRSLDIDTPFDLWQAEQVDAYYGLLGANTEPNKC